MEEIKIVAVYTALNGLLLLVLSYNVGQHRARTDALTPGDIGDEKMVRAMRAHGNASEYMPLAMLLLLLMALMSAPITLLHGLGAGFTLGRAAQSWGMTLEKHPNAIRFTGNLFTGIFYLVASVGCIYLALV